MGKKSTTIVKKELLHWTPPMDDALIDSYLNQHNLGNRVGGTFTTKALEYIVVELREKFPEKSIDKEKAQNLIKNIKRDFTRCYDIFKNGMSDFGWNPVTETWEAEPEFWDKLVESKPDTAEWRNKKVQNYEKLAQLYGMDRAMGEHVETSSDIRKRKASESNIEDIDLMVSQNHATLQSDDVINLTSPGDNPRPDVQLHNHIGTISKQKATKKKEIDEEAMLLKDGLDNVANAIRSLSYEFVKSTQLPIPANEVWKLLEDLGVESNRLLSSYRFLIQKPNMLTGLLGCPWESRKDLLFDMIDNA